MAKLPCIPPELPVANLDWRGLMPRIGAANAALARYDGILQALPNSAVLLSPIRANEAVLSSRIEGTQATLEEVLQQDAGIPQEESRLADIIEIMNYRAAVRIAERQLKHRHLTLSLLKGVHQRLLRGVRGDEKSPGQFRIEQNWIGKPGCTIEEARFIPPNPMVLPQALEQWERYLGTHDEDPILHVAVAHAQFEILHPFKDGNGRIGRMLIPLLLFQRHALSSPMFYLSEFLETHREQYYDGLLEITENGNWQGWVEFFIGAIIAQAESNKDKVRRMLTLYDSLKERVRKITHSQYGIPALDSFFKSPIINATKFAKQSGIENRVTSNGILKQFLKADIIRISRKGSGRSPAVYVLPELINIVEGKEVF